MKLVTWYETDIEEWYTGLPVLSLNHTFQHDNQKMRSKKSPQIRDGICNMHCLYAENFPVLNYTDASVECNSNWTLCRNVRLQHISLQVKYCEVCGSHKEIVTPICQIIQSDKGIGR